MSKEFEKFAAEIGTVSAEKLSHGRINQCPHCKEILSEAYVEQNPSSEVPCSSCGSPVTLQQLREPEDTVVEKRTEKRYPASLKVSYKTFNDFMDEYTKNVSQRGMFIRTRRPHALHEIAELLLHVPELPQPVRIKGEIVRVTFNAEREEDCGVGVNFIDIDDQSREALVSFIKSRENGQ